MKRNKKIIIIGIIVFILIIVIGGIFLINHFQFKKPNSNYVATVYHSEVRSVDDATAYTYYIYPKSKSSHNSYKYYKTKEKVTLKGSSKPKNVATGTINNKKDFDKITKDIAKENEKKAQTYIIYTYNGDGVTTDLETLDEFLDKLFK